MKKSKTKTEKKAYQVESRQKNYVKKTEQPGWVETRGRKPGFVKGNATIRIAFSLEKELVPVLRQLAKEKKFNMSRFVNAHLKSWVNLQLKNKSK
jgi:hypothetical protein